MPPVQIAVLNASTVLTDAQVQAVVPALQTQVSRDFAPVWGVDATLSFVARGHQPPAGAWWMSILDDADQAGALGYHDLTSAGLPLGKVFARTDLQSGSSWTVTVSHELLEMLADPDINRTVLATGAKHAGKAYAYEVCDAVEDDSLGYLVDGVRVSDFVTRAWFEPGEKTGPFDQGGHATAALQLAKGGYIGVYEFTGGKGWTQLTDATSRHVDRAPHGSRRERRRRDRALWRRSEP